MDFLNSHYLTIKLLHLVTVVISITLFTFRFALLQTRPTALKMRWLRVLPHINDSALLLFAGLLCVILRQAPGITPWLSEKVTLVVLYILAGMFTMKWAKRRPAQFAWFMIAVSLFGSALYLAVTKTPVIL